MFEGHKTQVAESTIREGGRQVSGEFGTVDRRGHLGFYKSGDEAGS